ncbi:MAG: hypothetical protein ABIV39_16490, partial [Verrucomicrobiota bacterium]
MKRIGCGEGSRSTIGLYQTTVSARTPKVRWLFISVVAVVLMVGVTYALLLHDRSALFVSFGIAAGMCLLFVVLPVAFVLLHDLGCWVFARVFDSVLFIFHKLSFRK